jgi:hypothetical protein
VQVLLLCCASSAAPQHFALQQTDKNPYLNLLYFILYSCDFTPGMHYYIVHPHRRCLAKSTQSSLLCWNFSKTIQRTIVDFPAFLETGLAKKISVCVHTTRVPNIKDD